MVSLFSLAAMAQSRVCIYKTDGSVLTSTIATVDSISFTPPGVLINGVYWASRNVAAPGTFATNPEDAGDFYQWNNNVGWPATGAIGDIVSTYYTLEWNSNWNGGVNAASASDTWATSRDPSPAGYRVPTYAEIQSLLNTTYVKNEWTTQNSVYGRKFTDIATGNSIFLPAPGYRYYNGTLNDAGSVGDYWSSTTNYIMSYHLFFSSSSAGYDSHMRTYGFAIRPVAE